MEPQQPTQSTPSEVSTTAPVTQPQPTPVVQQSLLQQLSTPIAIVIAGALIAGTIFFTRSASIDDTNVAGNQQPAQKAISIKDVDLIGMPFIGSESAPLTIVYWTDYQCPYCKKFEQETLPNVISDYVNTGKVKVVFKDFPFLGQDSITAGMAAQAVWKLYPNQYFAWREAMYKAQDAENSGFGDQKSILALTRTISGIDAKKVSDDVAAHQDEYQKKLTAERAEGNKLGIQGTPAILIGTELIPGALSFDEIKPTIDSALKNIR